MTKKIHYSAGGAKCAACGYVLAFYPFDEGVQHRFLNEHRCPKDRAEAELSKCQDELEEVLRKYGVSLETNWDGPSPGYVWLELTHTETGIERKVGGELA